MFKPEGASMEKHHDHNDHKQLFDQEWRKSQDNSFIGLLKDQEFDDIVKNLPEYRAAFLESGERLDSLCCSDGRVEFHSQQEGNDFEYDELKTAGQCILYSPQELEQFISENTGRIKRVASHFGCGAAGIKYKQMLADGTLPEGVTNSDELGIRFTKDLAERLGAAYSHIGQDELCCEVHNERALILDGTARFKPKEIKDFPPHFSSASLALGHDADYVRQEAEILSSIALGDHGFDTRFDQNNPFFIIVIAKDQAELDQTKASLAEFVAKSEGRVKLTGALVPESA